MPFERRNIMKKFIRVMALVLAVAMLAVLLPACKKDDKKGDGKKDGKDATTTAKNEEKPEEKAYTPDEYLDFAIGNTLNQSSGFFDEVAENRSGSVEVDLGGLFAVIGQLSGSEELSSISFKNKTYMSGNKFMDVITLGIMGSVADLTVYADENKIAASTNLLPGEAYGVDLQNFSFAGIKDSYLCQLIKGSADEDVDVDKILAALDKAMPLVEKYAQVLIETADKNVKSSIEDVKDGGKKLTYKIDADGIEAVLRDLYNVAKDDQELAEVLMAFGAGEDVFPDEETFNKNMAEMKEEPTDISLEIVTNKEDIIVSVTATIHNVEEDKTESSIVVSIDMSKADEAVLSIKGEGELAEEDFQNIVITYKITENTESKYSSSIDIKVGETAIDPITFDFDKTTGKFELTVSIPSGEMSDVAISVKINGTVTTTDDSVEVVLDKLNILGVSLNLGVSIKVLANDPMPEFPAEFTNIFEMTEEDFSTLGSKLLSSEFVQKVSALFATQIDEEVDPEYYFEVIADEEAA